MSSVNTEKTRRMVGLSILTALVIVLQFVAEYIKVGATPITLTLVPIVVGSALYGVRGGAWLGGVFGVVVWLMSIANIDPTGALLWNLNPFLTTVICIGKGALAGLAAAAAYRFVARKSGIGGVFAAAVVSPIVNTGIFCAGLFAFFNDTFNEWMMGWVSSTGNEANPLLYIILVLVGVNFLIEMGINLVLSPIIERIIRLRKKGAV